MTRAELREAYRVDRSYGGEIRARRTSTLGFRHAGEILAIHVEEGDRVASGMLLAELDPEPLEAALDQARARLAHAEASLEVAAAAAELARETSARHADLVDKGHISRQRFDETRLELAGSKARVRVAEAEQRRARADVRAARLDLERSRIRAPYDGRIQARHRDEGTILVPGQSVLRLVSSGSPEARIGLPTDVALELSPDADYRFRAGGLDLSGRLRRVLPEVDETTRTLTALFDLEATPLPAGSLIELRFSRRVSGSGFWLPLSALSEAQRGLWSVYVVAERDDAAIAERRLVEVLHTDGDRAYVQGTLHDGEQIVRSGTQRIVPGQRLSPAASP